MSFDGGWIGMTNSMKIPLGKGGPRPGLAAYDVFTGNVDEFLRLPPGGSVYAVSASPDGQTIAAGTKTGEIYYWPTPGEGDQENRSELVRRLAHGAPVASVCFVDASTLAVADTRGRCLLWPLREGAQPEGLPAGRRIIGSLVRLDSAQVAGLSVSGELVVWNWREKLIVRVLAAPPLPDFSALVAPVYWRSADTWVWPGRDGQMVFYEWRQGRLHTACGHLGDVYAIAACDEELLTIGRTDGRLKRWRAGCDEPVGDCAAPVGIIRAVLWGQCQFQVLLIDEAGRAGIYTWHGRRLEFERQLPGADYRVAVGPDLEEYRSAVRQRKAIRAQDLAGQAQEVVEQCQWDELEALCLQFAELGFEHVALALRAQAARGRDDLGAALQAYGKLRAILPPGHRGSRASLEQYAGLLEAVWRPGRALAAYQQLLEMAPADSGYQASVQRASDHARIIEGGSCVIETDVPLVSLVKAATTLGESFTGRYLIKEIGSPSTCQVSIAADELVQRYERIRQARPEVSLPQAEQVELSWLSSHRMDRVTTILFADKDSDRLGRLEFGIQFFDAGLQTVLAAVTVFNAGTCEGDLSIEQHNQAVLEQVQRITNGSLSTDGWLQMVHRTAIEAIRQLITKGQAGRYRS
jgi:hypothetical protein